MRAQRFDGELEFIFAHGRSTDRTLEILVALAEQDPRIRVFDNPGGSVSSGLNVALGHARGRWVARMDAHTEYPEAYVALGVERLERGGTRWVSGPPLPTGDNLVSRAVAVALSSHLGRGGSRKWGTGPADRDADAEYELDSGVFAGVWSRATLLEYSGWDERWPSNEDSELAARFLARNERLVCLPAMGAHYVPRGSLAALWRQYLSYGEYRAKTSARHPHTLRRSNLLPPAVVVTAALAVAAPRRVRAGARAGLAVYAAVLASAGVRSAPVAAPSEALLVPVVLLIMHVAHGAGFIRGAARHGVPVAALASIAHIRPLAARAPSSDPVFNPSLSSQGRDR
jgi:hypothetical protein